MGSSSDGTAGVPPIPLSSATIGVERPSGRVAECIADLEEQIRQLAAQQERLLDRIGGGALSDRDMILSEEAVRKSIAAQAKVQIELADIVLRQREVAAAEALRDHRDSDEEVIPPLAQDIAH